ncbi:membrane protein insertion efficiency factor YidD [Candidatus Woesearchaeota archaeon]|nr:membrane protein insertion efficiency factor YidD [Candidatus Woesearchaeota archaeon]
MLIELSIWFITNIHQKGLSPKLNKLGSKCRFYPTCSDYGLIAIKKYGFFYGWIKIINRVWRCKPNNYNHCIDYP